MIKTLTEKLNILQEKFFFSLQQADLTDLKSIQHFILLQLNTNISKQEITNVISDILKEKASGPDNILNYILKLINDSLLN